VPVCVRSESSLAALTRHRSTGRWPVLITNALLSRSVCRCCGVSATSNAADHAAAGTISAARLLGGRVIAPIQSEVCKNSVLGVGSSVSGTNRAWFFRWCHIMMADV